MEYQAQLDFLRQLLMGLNISTCVVEDPASEIPPAIDLHLRAELFGLENYKDFLQNSMSQAADRTVYRFSDEYDCNYIFLRLEGQRYFFIGPYLLSLPDRQRVESKSSQLRLSPEHAKRMQQYYNALPVVEDENLLLTMANTFARHLWGSPEAYAMEYVDYAIPDRYAPITFTPVPVPPQEKQTLSALEHSYEKENRLMEAVSKGKLHLVTFSSASAFAGAEQRLPDSLRDQKNYLITLKTLLRKAAERGGVHPMHIHRLSDHFALSIENARYVKQTTALVEEMIRSFCQLVKQHSLSKYSYYVGQTITLVQFDLTADLRLKTIAQTLNVNSSYLSSLFHREVGCTLTEYINRQRIDRGIRLLQLTSKPVQEIAAECGIHDVNYFIKLFKAQTGFTPARYRHTL